MGVRIVSGMGVLYVFLLMIIFLFGSILWFPSSDNIIINNGLVDDRSGRVVMVVVRIKYIGSWLYTVIVFKVCVTLPKLTLPTPTPPPLSLSALYTHRATSRINYHRSHRSAQLLNIRCFTLYNNNVVGTHALARIIRERSSGGFLFSLAEP